MSTNNMKTFKDILRSKLNNLVVLTNKTLKPSQVNIFEHVLTLLDDAPKEEKDLQNHLFLNVQGGGKTFTLALLCVSYMFSVSDKTVTFFGPNRRHIYEFISYVQDLLCLLDPTYKKWSMTRTNRASELVINDNKLFFYPFINKFTGHIESGLILLDECDYLSYDTLNKRLKDYILFSDKKDPLFSKYLMIGCLSIKSSQSDITSTPLPPSGTLSNPPPSIVMLGDPLPNDEEGKEMSPKEPVEDTPKEELIAKPLEGGEAGEEEKVRKIRVSKFEKFLLNPKYKINLQNV